LFVGLFQKEYGIERAKSCISAYTTREDNGLNIEIDRERAHYVDLLSNKIAEILSDSSE